jgi:hypothetical protein
MWRAAGTQRVYAGVAVTQTPYDAPQSPPAPGDSPKPLRLFTPLAVGVHAFLLPPSGALLVALNYARLHDRPGVWKALGYLALGVALLGLGLALMGRPGLFLVYIARIVFANLLYLDQRPVVQKHLADGGRRGRWAFGWLLGIPALVAGVALWQVLHAGR